MVSIQSQKRLTKEYKAIRTSPPPYVTARPNEENILEWHYIITGPPNTPFENGQYHGLLRFPSEYPFKPPAITMVTPNGRFACNTRLCLSMSDYHPDTWNPAWSVSTILTGLLSFMTSDESTTGSINTSENLKKKYSRESKRWNIAENPRFVKIFPELIEQNNKDIAEMEKQELLQLNAGTNISEALFNVKENSHLLDPEDRARLLVDDTNQTVGVNVSKFTFIGVAIAAFFAYLIKS